MNARTPIRQSERFAGLRQKDGNDQTAGCDISDKYRVIERPTALANRGVIDVEDWERCIPCRTGNDCHRDLKL